MLLKLCGEINGSHTEFRMDLHEFIRVSSRVPSPQTQRAQPRPSIHAAQPYLLCFPQIHLQFSRVICLDLEKSIL